MGAGLIVSAAVMMAWARGSLARAHDLPAVVDAIGFAEGSAERPEVGHGATLAEKGVGRWNLQRGIRYQQQVVGDGSVPPSDENIHAFLWQRGTMTDLGTLGGDDSTARSSGRSWASPTPPRASCTSSGKVGRKLVANGGRGSEELDKKTNRTMTDLWTLAGDQSEANGINNRGQIVGGSTTASGEFHAVLWMK